MKKLNLAILSIFTIVYASSMTVLLDTSIKYGNNSHNIKQTWINKSEYESQRGVRPLFDLDPSYVYAGIQYYNKDGELVMGSLTYPDVKPENFIGDYFDPKTGLNMKGTLEIYSNDVPENLVLKGVKYYQEDSYGNIYQKIGTLNIPYVHPNQVEQGAKYVQPICSTVKDQNMAIKACYNDIEMKPNANVLGLVTLEGLMPTKNWTSDRVFNASDMPWDFKYLDQETDLAPGVEKTGYSLYGATVSGFKGDPIKGITNNTSSWSKNSPIKVDKYGSNAKNDDIYLISVYGSGGTGTDASSCNTSGTIYGSSGAQAKRLDVIVRGDLNITNVTIGTNGGATLLTINNVPYSSNNGVSTSSVNYQNYEYAKTGRAGSRYCNSHYHPGSFHCTSHSSKGGCLDGYTSSGYHTYSESSGSHVSPTNGTKGIVLIYKLSNPKIVVNTNDWVNKVEPKYK